MSSVGSAYDAVAALYVSRFGSVAHAHPADRALIVGWRDETTGRLLDAGCGPGHWSAMLRGRAAPAEVTGLDASAAFVATAQTRFGVDPLLTFRQGDLRALPFADGAFGGVLAWYSLIHLDPDELPIALAECARVTGPGGGLLVGAFDGDAGRPFEHAVSRAWFWDQDALRELLTDAGFTVIGVQRRSDPSARPHLAVRAVRTPAAQHGMNTW